MARYAVGPMANEPRGAGTGGGLLFLVVGLVVGYLVLTALAGLVRWVLGVALVVGLVILALRVVGRR